MSKNNKSFKSSVREKPQSQRQLKVSKAIHTSLIEYFRKGGQTDPKLIGFPMTITKINISPDLKSANCFFVPFNTKLTPDEISAALESARYSIRDFVTRKINLKYSPEIRFFYDSSYENLGLIESLLKKI